MSERPALLGARRVRELLSSATIRPRRKWGQNFVVDPNTIRKMLRAAEIDPGDIVLEIGAGLGSLTLGLASRATRVVAMEIDARLTACLRTVVADAPNVKVVEGDALKLDLGDFGAGALVANLPYNIASTLVLKALQEAGGISRFTVMCQREVGERMAAGAGGKDYGVTSVLIARHGRATVVARIARTTFYPVPNVDSVIVRVVRHRDRILVNDELFKRLVKTAFAQRRKSLRSSLAPVTGNVAAAEELLTGAGIPSLARAEELGLEQFVALTRGLSLERPRV